MITESYEAIIERVAARRKYGTIRESRPPGHPCRTVVREQGNDLVRGGFNGFRVAKSKSWLYDADTAFPQNSRQGNF
jgi:hypothetical protein